MNSSVAQILPLLDTAHLDRLFDYYIPDDFLCTLHPGMKVRVRFHGRLVDGIVYHINEFSDFPGKLESIERIISPFIVLNGNMRTLVEKIASRYAGTRPEIIRLILPKRIARIESMVSHDASDESYIDNHRTVNYPVLQEEIHTVFSRDCDSNKSFLKSPSVPDEKMRIVWQLGPYQNWMESITRLVQCYLRHGLGVIILVPTVHRVKEIFAYLHSSLAQEYKGYLEQLSGDEGPEKRYRSWLRILLGQAKIVIGARSAVYSPVCFLGAIIMFDDGDDNYSELLAPYPHSRTVAVQRSIIDNCALFLIGYSRSVESHALVLSGWARSISIINHELLPKAAALSSRVLEDPYQAHLRIPQRAFSLIFECLAKKEPVLIHVYRRGYSHALYCLNCKESARCRNCHGLVTQHEDNSLQCCWCSAVTSRFRCLVCGQQRLGSSLPGVQRTAAELGRAFSPYPVIMSSGEKMYETIPNGSCIVIATSGAEPRVPHGYGTGIILDLTFSLLRPDLRVYEDVYRQMMNFLSYLKPQADVLIAADVEIPFVQAIINYHPLRFVHEELESRTSAGFPPAMRLATLDGQDEVLVDFMSYLRLPDIAEILGPVPLPRSAAHLNERVFGSSDNRQRIIIRIPIKFGPQLSEALRDARKRYSMGKKNTFVRIAVDPLHIG